MPPTPTTTLCLRRKVGEAIVIDGPATITVVESSRGRTRLRIEAAMDVRILREELVGAVPPEFGEPVG